MELHVQIKKYRTNMELSQEELAEKVFVTRQSISNWETGKNYPDIHSLLLLSNVFGISLDQLIKGDIEIMREEIREADIAEFNHYGNVFSVLFFVTLISFVPLVKFLDIVGLVIAVVLWIVTLLYSIKLEKFYKRHDIRTYKEIVAFSEGKRLDEMETVAEKAKRPYQKVFMAIGSALVAIVVFALLEWLL